MKVLFIINPAAGGSNRSEEVTGAVRKVLGSEGGVFEIKATKEKGHAGRLAQEAVDKGFDVVFACGGDGTVNEVGSSLVRTRAVLGIVPVGSGNALARALRVPVDPEGALVLLKKKKVVEMDAGVLCGRHFFSTAGLGFDACLSKRYNESFLAKRVRGVAPYVALALLEYLKFTPSSFHIKTGGNIRRVDPFLLTAANTERWGGPAVIAPGANPSDGKLDICIVTGVGPMSLPVLVYKFLRGRIDTFKGYRRILTDSMDVMGRPGTVVHVDGEPFECTGDISIRVVPRGLRVLSG